MRKIKNITNYIKEELCDAEKYANCALKAKGDGDTMIYDTALKLATQELNHALDWHNVAVQLIDKAKTEVKSRGEEPPKFMMDYWDEVHEDYVKEYAEIKTMIDLLSR